MDTAINILIFVITAISLLFCFRKEGRWDLQKGLKSLRFFTILSNLFCAVSALLLVLSSSQWAWLLKYVGTVAVTVTLLTVMFFLGPNMGYKQMFSGKDLYSMATTRMGNGSSVWPQCLLAALRFAC